ncbi:MAG TPA: PQQ-binding-like beta-propeller repeat protein [Dongiaceae bacterium]|nr:PQQ-binding-like beta-propeller repeat protein [Dongiaceae bacterium]
MKHSLARCGCIILSVLALPARGSGQEWTRFRGPNGSGVSAAKGIPTVWTDNDINWKAPLPGAGHSSPVLWGDRIFLTTGDASTNRLWLLCLSAQGGQVLWQEALPLSPYHRHPFNTVASGSPAVDERRVYVCWSEPERIVLSAFDHDGRRAWEKDLGPFVSQHGGGASPILYRDKVILANQQDGPSFWVALDAATGEVRWKTPRQSAEANYSTPCLYEPEPGKPELIFTSHAHGISGVDPDTGAVLWELSGVFDKRVVSSPILAGGLVVAACGSGEGGTYLVAARPGDAANRKPELAYTVRRAPPYVPTSICLGPLLFLWSNEGVVSCLRAASGEVKWQERLGKQFFSSPVCVEERLFGVSTGGEVVVLAASDRFQLLARYALGETTHSTPAVAGGRMYIHTAKHLISVGGHSRADAKE